MGRPLFSVALDALFPPTLLDGGGPALATGLSPEAWTKIAFIESPLCDGCGAPFEYETGLRCVACEARPQAFDRARAACVYDENSRELILKFKHADRTDLAPLLAHWLSRAAGEILPEAEAVVPVPLHATRLFSRRYNQAAEVGRVLAARAGKTYLADALVRRRDTGSQAGKSGGGRRRNVAAAFEVPAGRRGQVAGKAVLVIDDVMTTGATLEGCARALKAAGAARVDVAVIARVKEAANLTI